MYYRFFFAFLVLLLTMLLGACSQQQDASALQKPVPIASGDECHVCGMQIKRFPGPKAEAYVQGNKTPYKFCSTRDMFAWFLQPETATVVGKIFVHDMGATNWQSPSDNDFIDARTAWYVVGSNAKGAMGPTLASFKDRDAAMAFVAKNGGTVMPFSAVDLAVLDSLNTENNMPGMPMKGSKNEEMPNSMPEAASGKMNMHQ